MSTGASVARIRRVVCREDEFELEDTATDKRVNLNIITTFTHHLTTLVTPARHATVTPANLPNPNLDSRQSPRYHSLGDNLHHTSTDIVSAVAKTPFLKRHLGIQVPN